MGVSAHSSSLHGLYLILDESWVSRCSFIDVLKQAGKAGVGLVQYRNKGASMKEAFQQAEELREAARTAGILFIVNDRCDLALALEADGVHVGQDDLALHHARALLGDECLIGISTHRPEEVQEATKGGADYLGFGPIFETSTKKDHEALVGVSGLNEVRTLTSLPIFAIGGITAESLPELINAGADGVAVASAIFGAPDRQAALRQFTSAFK